MVTPNANLDIQYPIETVSIEDLNSFLKNETMAMATDGKIIQMVPIAKLNENNRVSNELFLKLSFTALKRLDKVKNEASLDTVNTAVMEVGQRTQSIYTQKFQDQYKEVKKALDEIRAGKLTRETTLFLKKSQLSDDFKLSIGKETVTLRDRLTEIKGANTPEESRSKEVKIFAFPSSSRTQSPVKNLKIEIPQTPKEQSTKSPVSSTPTPSTPSNKTNTPTPASSKEAAPASSFKKQSPTNSLPPPLRSKPPAQSKSAPPPVPPRPKKEVAKPEESVKSNPPPKPPTKGGRLVTSNAPTSKVETSIEKPKPPIKATEKYPAFPKKPMPPKPPGRPGASPPQKV
jgi:hypothetical protein